MKQVIISVPDMQSTHCQTRVSNAIKEIKGVQIQNLETGNLTVSLTSDELKNEVKNAIEKAGYTVSSEDGNNASDYTTGCCSK